MKHVLCFSQNQWRRPRSVIVLSITYWGKRLTTMWRSARRRRIGARFPGEIGNAHLAFLAILLGLAPILALSQCLWLGPSHHIWAVCRWGMLDPKGASRRLVIGQVKCLGKRPVIFSLANAHFAFLAKLLGLAFILALSQCHHLKEACQLTLIVSRWRPPRRTCNIHWSSGQRPVSRAIGGHCCFGDVFIYIYLIIKINSETELRSNFAHSTFSPPGGQSLAQESHSGA